MKDMDYNVERLETIIKPDVTRVLLRPFVPSSEERVTKIFSRAMLLSESKVNVLLGEVFEEFSSRHLKLEEILLRRYEELKEYSPIDDEPSQKRKLLIGSYFMCEYALESAAIFNPSMVLHPDQRGLPKGSARYVISLRSTGEGHISSISFRECILDSNASIDMVPKSKIVKCPEPISDQSYHKETFAMKLFELGITCEFSNSVLNALGSDFTEEELNEIINNEVLARRGRDPKCEENAENIRVLARSNFSVTFKASLELSSKVLFPHSPSQRKGIEDARFVRFINEDGSVQYYATFTAYDGKIMLCRRCWRLKTLTTFILLR